MKGQQRYLMMKWYFFGGVSFEEVVPFELSFIWAASAARMRLSVKVKSCHTIRLTFGDDKRHTSEGFR